MLYIVNSLSEEHVSESTIDYHTQADKQQTCMVTRPTSLQTMLLSHLDHTHTES